MDEESSEVSNINRSDVSALHQKVADDLFKSHGEWEESVKRAFDAFNGDFDQFQQSLCYKLLVEQSTVKHVTSYTNGTLETLNMTSLEVFSKTKKNFESIYPDNTETVEKLCKAKDALRRFVGRKLEASLKELKDAWKDVDEDYKSKTVFEEFKFDDIVTRLGEILPQNKSSSTTTPTVEAVPDFPTNSPFEDSSRLLPGQGLEIVLEKPLHIAMGKTVSETEKKDIIPNQTTMAQLQTHPLNPLNPSSASSQAKDVEPSPLPSGKEADTVEQVHHGHGDTLQNHTPSPTPLYPSPPTIQKGNSQIERLHTLITDQPPPSPPPPAPGYPPPQPPPPPRLANVPLTLTHTVATGQSKASPPPTNSPPHVQGAATVTLPSAFKGLRPLKHSEMDQAEQKMREEFLFNATLSTPESSYFTGIGTLKIKELCMHISKVSCDRRSTLKTSTILRLHNKKPKNPEVAHAIDYPYQTAGSVHDLNADEIFDFPNFENNDKVLICEGSAVHMGQVYDRTVWVNVANKDSSLRALCKDHFEMSAYNDSQGSPIRFHGSDLQAHHDVGSILLLAHEDDFVIGIVTGQISTSDPLKIDVTIATELVQQADRSFKIQFQEVSFLRTHRMRKVILQHDLNSPASTNTIFVKKIVYEAFGTLKKKHVPEQQTIRWPIFGGTSLTRMYMPDITAGVQNVQTFLSCSSICSIKSLSSSQIAGLKNNSTSKSFIDKANTFPLMVPLETNISTEGTDGRTYQKVKEYQMRDGVLSAILTRNKSVTVPTETDYFFDCNLPRRVLTCCFGQLVQALLLGRAGNRVFVMVTQKCGDSKSWQSLNVKGIKVSDTHAQTKNAPVILTIDDVSTLAGIFAPNRVEIPVNVHVTPKFIMSEPTRDAVDFMNKIFPGMGDQMRVIWLTQQRLSTNANTLVEVQEACVGLADVVLHGICQRSFTNVKMLTHETDGSSGNERLRKKSKKEDFPVHIPKTARDYLKGEYPHLINEKLNIFCDFFYPCQKSILDCELDDIFSDVPAVWNVLLGCVHEADVQKAYEVIIPESKRSAQRFIMFDQFYKNVNETLQGLKKESEKGCIKSVAQEKMCVIYPHVYKLEKAANSDEAEEDDDEDFAPNPEDDSAALLVGHDEAFEFGEAVKGNMSPDRKIASGALIALKRQKLGESQSLSSTIRRNSSLGASAIGENDSHETKALSWFRKIGDGLHGMLSSLGNIQDGVISFAKVPSAKDPADVIFRYSVLIVAKIAPSLNKKLKGFMTPEENASLLGLNVSWDVEKPTQTSEDFINGELAKLSGKKFSSLRKEILSMSQKLSSDWLHEQNENEQSDIIALELNSWREETMQMVHDEVLKLEKVDENYLPGAHLSQGLSEEEKKRLVLDVLICASLRMQYPSRVVGILNIVSDEVGNTLQSYSGLLYLVRGQLNKLDKAETKGLHDTAIADALAGLCIEDSDLDDVFCSDANQPSEGSGDESAVEDAALTGAPMEGAALAAAPVVGEAFTAARVEEAAFPTAAVEDAAFPAGPVEDAALTGAPTEVAALAAASVVDAVFTIAPVEEAAVATAELEDAAFTAAPVEDAAAPDHGGNDEEKADDVGGQTNKKQRIEEKN